MPQSLTNVINNYFCQNNKSIQDIGNIVNHSIGSVDIEIRIGNLGPISHNLWITREFRDYDIIHLANSLVISPAKSELHSASSESRAKLLFCNSATYTDRVFNL